MHKEFCSCIPSCACPWMLSNVIQESAFKLWCLDCPSSLFCLQGHKGSSFPKALSCANSVTWKCILVINTCLEFFKICTTKHVVYNGNFCIYMYSPTMFSTGHAQQQITSMQSNITVNYDREGLMEVALQYRCGLVWFICSSFQSHI
jgi:hypothetical protein